MKLIDRAAGNWKYLAICLGIPYFTIESIEHQHVYVQNCCYVAMRQWLHGNHIWPVTWATLIEALKKARLLTLAHDLEMLLEDFGKLWEEVEEIKEIGKVMKEE